MEATVARCFADFIVQYVLDRRRRHQYKVLRLAPRLSRSHARIDLYWAGGDQLVGCVKVWEMPGGGVEVDLCVGLLSPAAERGRALEHSLMEFDPAAPDSLERAAQWVWDNYSVTRQALG